MMLRDSIALNGIKYEWLGQSGVRMTSEDGSVIYIDPVMLDEGAPAARLILISHHHVDHCLPEFITPIRGEKTRLAAFHDSYIKYCVADIKGVRTVKVGETIELAGVRVTGVAAYAEKGFHMQGEGCGFLIEFRGETIYFAGDTGRTEEMDSLSGIDCAILPIADNTYSIKMEDIAEAVKIMRPRLFIPVHFTPIDEPSPEVTGEMFFSKDPRFFTIKEDPERLAKLLEGTGIEVALLRKLGGGVGK
ncbi:MAG: MBL fold metallo-hydrolase [Deltaproteobacteria bacterium]|nr:MBL fold metallo-hydrolase [Deltaproteobacteria bacterium]